MIKNNFTHPVIADDLRDPFVSWRHHQARGSLGGVDLAYPYGAPIYAPAPGRGYGVAWNGTGGHTYILKCAEGSIEFMHLSEFGNIGDIKTGDYLGKSGGSGPGRNLRYYDAHLHVHIVVNGVRRNLWDYFTSTPAALDPIELVLDNGDNKMEMIVSTPGGTVVHFSPRGKTNFESEKEYNEWRSTVDFYNRNTVDSKMVLPPELKQVIGVSWERYKLICRKFQVTP